MVVEQHLLKKEGVKMMVSSSYDSSDMTTMMMTTRIGIMASHEQVNATDLLTDVIAMEKTSPERCWVSDHYMPWWHDGGFAGATWPWLRSSISQDK